MLGRAIVDIGRGRPQRRLYGCENASMVFGSQSRVVDVVLVLANRASSEERCCRDHKQMKGGKKGGMGFVS